jgi:exonuclease SbcC
MKLTLKNFRCYENMAFDFGDKGLTLLSGSSGKGKTTLLMAIDFALFGTGTKIVANGKKSCSVELEFGGLKIIRKKGPNHLLVNDKYEDDAGEAIIQEKFGKIFNSVSYIPQNLKKTFVLMSPTDRLEFLETFAFNNFDVSNLKDRAKVVIKESNDTLSKTIGNLQFATKMLEEKPKPELKPFPGKVAKEAREKYISNMEIKYKNSIILIKKAEKENAELIQKKAKKDVLLARKEEKEKTAANLQAEQDRYKSELSGIPEQEDDLQSLEARLEYQLKIKKTMQLIKSIEESKAKLADLEQKELQEMMESMSLMESQLWQEGSFEELVEEVESWKIIVERKKELANLNLSLSRLKETESTDSLVAQLEKFKEAIRDNERDIERAKFEKECFSCPHCRSKVRFFNNALVMVDVVSQAPGNLQDILQNYKNLKKLNQMIKDAEVSIENSKKRDAILKQIQTVSAYLAEIIEEDGGEVPLQECEQNLKAKQDAITKNTELERKMKTLSSDIKSGVFSATISRLKKQITEDEKKVDKLDDFTVEDEEELRSRIWKVKSLMQKRAELKNRISETAKNLENLYEKELKTIQKELEEFNDNDYNEKSEKNNEEIKTHTERKISIEKFMKEVELWRQNEKEVLEYKKLEKSVQDLRGREIEDRKKYAAACLFRDNILEAESIYISNIISSINTHVQMYLDYFFPDNPISVRLSSFKENNKNETKPYINLEIDYRGIEHDLSMLSGGELSRVILSFTLAFADLYGSPLILLDECTASLDQDLTSSVIAGLKDNFGEKLVVLIAHQVVQGTFDKVIELK